MTDATQPRWLDDTQQEAWRGLRAIMFRAFPEIAISEDPDDRRAKNATLTEAGRERLERVAPIHAEDVQRLIFDRLDPEQTKALADALAPVADALCSHPEFLNPSPT